MSEPNKDSKKVLRIWSCYGCGWLAGTFTSFLVPFNLAGALTIFAVGFAASTIADHLTATVKCATLGITILPPPKRRVKGKNEAAPGGCGIPRRGPVLLLAKGNSINQAVRILAPTALRRQAFYWPVPNGLQKELKFAQR